MGSMVEALGKLMVFDCVDQLLSRAVVMEAGTAAVHTKRGAVRSEVDYVAGAFEILRGQ